jgi:hypothetical protein
MSPRDGTVISATDKAFDVEFGQTTKWDGDQLIVISAFWRRRTATPAARPCQATPGARRRVPHP